MACVKRADIQAALLKKGFKQRENDHAFFYFYYNEKQTKIRTKLSHGSGHSDIGDNLLGLIAKQLKLTKKELLSYIECHIKEEQYAKILSEKGILIP